MSVLDKKIKYSIEIIDYATNKTDEPTYFYTKKQAEKYFNETKEALKNNNLVYINFIKVDNDLDFIKLIDTTKEEITWELCPYCENEVILKNEFKIQICSECRKKILPCSICKNKICSRCPLEERIL